MTDYGPWYQTIGREKDLLALAIQYAKNPTPGGYHEKPVTDYHWEIIAPGHAECFGPHGGMVPPISCGPMPSSIRNQIANLSCPPGMVAKHTTLIGSGPQYACVPIAGNGGYHPSVTEIPTNGGTLPNARMVPTSSSDGLSKFLQKLIGDLDKFKQPTVVVAPSQPTPAQPAGFTWDWSAIVKGALIGVAIVMLLRMLR